MGRHKKIIGDYVIKPTSMKPPVKTNPEESCNWFILQGFSFEGIIYNRGEQVPEAASFEFLENLYEKKYIGKITATGIQLFSRPAILTNLELVGLHRFSPPVLKSYIEARNVSKESLEKAVEMNKLNPESLNIVLSRIAILGTMNCNALI